MADVEPIISRVIGLLEDAKLRVIYGVGVGMLDGGIETSLDVEVVPEDLRFPNSVFKLGFKDGVPYVVRIN